MRARLRGVALGLATIVLSAVPGAAACAGTTRDLSFLTAPDASEVRTRVNSAGDEVFTDPLGREILLRGFAVSGSTKLAESGFLPFRSTADAARSFEKMKQDTGAGVVRFQISWEGVEPSPGVIDRAYLGRAADQIKEATSRGIRVIVEYHSDLASRGLFRPDSWFTGNGMPRWAIDALGLTGKEYCGPVCVTWGQHYLTDNSGVRPASRAFWENAQITAGGKRIGVRDEFVWQFGEAMSVLRDALGSREFSRVAGAEPANEPVDGGMGRRTPAQWENELLWPFYRQIRSTMDERGWLGKLLFAEPNVFWKSELDPVVPRLGVHADPKPGRGIVFTPHYYDTRRQVPGALAPGNGTYFKQFDEIRDTARKLGTPVLGSEFGTAVGGTGEKDTNRTVQAMYQALESTEDKSSSDPRDLAEYARVVSSEQWHWDIYRGEHHELVNGNPSRVESKGDAWNGEDFSVTEPGPEYTVDPANVRRIYPQAVQGELRDFACNARSQDAEGKRLDWLTLSPGDGHEYFGTTNFASLVWKGRSSQAPTQIFLPPQVDPATTAVITDTGVRNGVRPGSAGSANEVRFVPGRGGGQLLYWTDPAPGQTAETRHFAVVVPDAPRALAEAGAITPEQQQRLLESIRTNLVRTVSTHNPARLTSSH